ncbi:MAG: hypothetical protein GY757_62450, partial [bacterium]|nr:hypothetical protein [bacterium]
MMEISKKMVLCALLALTMLVTAFAGEKVVEKVSVDWWVIPFFAVDSSGKSITQLTEQDIQLKVDGKVVENFTIVKKDFSVPGELKAAPQNAKTQPVPERKKNVFMLFDTAVSSKEATVKSKAIARKIIKNSAKGTRFFILTIEPFAGLVYTGGGTDNKSQLLRIIDKEVKEKNNSRLPMASDIIADTGGKHSKYDEQDLAFLTSRAGQIHVRRSKSFLRSFESLYYTLNGIKDNKFVYLFSEGISNAVRDRVRGAYSVFTEYLKDVAGYLGRSGAVLFIINPYGSNTPGDSTTSGEDSLKIMAHNSGGKYLEGNDKVILEKINHIHQAYYEIFFRSKIQSKSGMMAIDITSKRKGIEVHSMKATERARKYPEMKKVEREVMVL